MAKVLFLPFCFSVWLDHLDQFDSWLTLTIVLVLVSRLLLANHPCLVHVAVSVGLEIEATGGSVFYLGEAWLVGALIWMLEEMGFSLNFIEDHSPWRLLIQQVLFEVEILHHVVLIGRRNVSL